MGTTGGLVLVAEVGEADGARRLVADAGYAPSTSGEPELALTVAPGWRGWLGPFLLDTLLEAAASRGIDALDAVILVENRAMMALARARGFVVVEHPDWTSARVRLSTSDRVPHWPAGHDRPRLLVEGAGGHWRAEEDARRAGFDVLTCPGPAAFPAGHCPVLEGRSCPLAAEADAIVFALPPDDERSRAVLAGHRELSPTTPVEADDPDLDSGGLIELLRRVTWQASTGSGPRA
jgi:hypothetical protein